MLWVFPPYNFYVFNVKEGLATWFGESSPFYHLVVSIPIMFTSMLPFVLHGIYIAYRNGTVPLDPAIVAALASLVFSLVGHMEYRFLFPLLPIGFLYAAASLQSLRGVADVMAYLRQRAGKGEVESIGFLMPCHSTPFYSHLHKNIPMWFLSCEPPLTKAELATHYCEADDFEQNPSAFLDSIFASKASASSALQSHLGNPHPKPGSPRPLPSHFVLYSCMADRINAHLARFGYGECARFFNTYFSGDSRRAGDVLVYCKDTPKN
ncbi:glycosylphosphatidylinositol anchor biosynthesis [Dipsacomyces acuminosporus]|nr:glycosylphosphatidylinositol anchor biosynthesis [Dipsacomyces acuminosporus]